MGLPRIYEKLKSTNNNFTGVCTVIDITDDSSDSQITNKKYVDSKTTEVVKYASSQPDDADVPNGCIVFFPAVDLLS